MTSRNRPGPGTPARAPRRRMEMASPSLGRRRAGRGTSVKSSDARGILDLVDREPSGPSTLAGSACGRADRRDLDRSPGSSAAPKREPAGVDIHVDFGGCLGSEEEARWSCLDGFAPQDRNYTSRRLAANRKTFSAALRVWWRKPRSSQRMVALAMPIVQLPDNWAALVRRDGALGTDSEVDPATALGQRPTNPVSFHQAAHQVDRGRRVRGPPAEIIACSAAHKPSWGQEVSGRRYGVPSDAPGRPAVEAVHLVQFLDGRKPLPPWRPWPSPTPYLVRQEHRSGLLLNSIVGFG